MDDGLIIKKYKEENEKEKDRKEKERIGFPSISYITNILVESIEY